MKILKLFLLLTTIIVVQLDILCQKTKLISPAHLDGYFYNAIVYFYDVKDIESAKEIENAARYVQMELAETELKKKVALEKIVRELDSLSVAVGAGKVDDVKRLKKTFSKTHYALSRKYYAKAVSLWSTKQVKKTGEALRKTNSHLSHGARWAGHEIGQGTKSTLRATRKVTKSAINGVGFVPEKMTKGISFLGKEIKKLGQKISNQNKQPYEYYFIDEYEEWMKDLPAE